MKETRVANRYAKALFDLAIELDVLENVYKDAQLINNVCSQSHDFLLVMHSPIVKEVKKLDIIKEIFEKHIHELTFKFLVIITRNRREALVMKIAVQFVEIYKKYKNILSATLSTAVEIDEETRDKIIGLLNKHTKSKIELTEKIDEELIGGFVLAFDDKQYDASILRQIMNLRQEFETNLYEKGF